MTSTNEPIQYLKGYANFYGLKFISDKRALIPRFETEFLVKKTIAWCLAKNHLAAWQIADIGTGSGIIAISLAVNLPQAKITATDISLNTLALAQENARRQKVFNRIKFTLGHLLSPITTSPNIILANLPYLPTNRLPLLVPEVRDFEPHPALDGGGDGFDLYRQLLDQIARLSLLPQLCIFEIDHDQSEIAQSESKKRLSKMSLKILKDSSELNRYMVLELP